MAIEVKLPELGDGIESGDVLDVLISEGDTIDKDQTICELETDKATVEVPSSHAGTVTKVHVEAGQSIPIGATLLTLESSDAAPTPPAEVAPEAPAAETQAESAPAPVEEAPAPAPESAPPKPTPPKPAPLPASPPTPVAAPSPPPAPAAQVAEGEPAPAGPAIRRLAREVGINLSRVQGTGSGGRITREDVLAAVRRSSASPRRVRNEPSRDGECDSPNDRRTTGNDNRVNR